MTAAELDPSSPTTSRNRQDPTELGYYSKQGKGSNELDPEVDHGSYPAGVGEDTSVPYDVATAGYEGSVWI